MVLGGVTYVTSSGIAAKVLGDLGRLGNRETPVVLSILVICVRPTGLFRRRSLAR